MSLLDASVLGQSRRLHQLWRLMGDLQSYLVGGFIRDRLIGRPSADLDLVLAGDHQQTAAPAQRVARHLGTRAHLLGRPPRCIWRIEGQRLKVELWPLGDLSLAEDAMRRDFSCNALLWKLPDGPLIDLVGGLDDLAQRRLRAIRRHNLASDPVRLLRGPRFVASLPGFELEATTRGWIGDLAPRLRAAPAERIGAELLALLRAPGASRGLVAMHELGLMEGAAPAAASVDLEWYHDTIGAASRLADPRRHPLPGALRDAGDSARLAWLVRLWRVAEAKSLSPFGWPRRTLGQACHAATLVDASLTRASGSAASARLLVHAAGAALPTLVALGSARDAGEISALADWRRLWRLWQRSGPTLVQPTPLLDAAAIMELLGIDSGPALGDAMRALVEAQLRGELRTAKGAARWLRRWYEGQA